MADGWGPQGGVRGRVVVAAATGRNVERAVGVWVFRGRLTMTGLCESICCLVFNFARNLGVRKVLFEWISCGFGGMGWSVWFVGG